MNPLRRIMTAEAMAIIETTPETAATGIGAPHTRRRHRSPGLRPQPHPGAGAESRGIYGLTGAAGGHRRIPRRARCALVTLAGAGSLPSAACLLADGTKALVAMGGEQLLLRGPGYSGLSPAEQAMMGFAAKLSSNASTMDDADTRSLRDAGFSDTEIVDATLAAAARN